MALAVEAEDGGDEHAATDDDAFAGVEAISFFGGLDRPEHDRAVCRNVYRIYLRESVERGFADRERALAELAVCANLDTRVDRGIATEATTPEEEQRRVVAREAARSRRRELATVVPPDPPAAREEAVVMRRQNNELDGVVREKHASLAQGLGRPPKVSELFKAIGARAKSENALRFVVARLELPLTKRRSNGSTPAKTNGAAAANGHATPRARKSAPPPVNSASSETEVGAGLHASLAIIALEGERTKIAGELAAVDSVLARLRGHSGNAR